MSLLLLVRNFRVRLPPVTNFSLQLFIPDKSNTSKSKLIFMYVHSSDTQINRDLILLPIFKMFICVVGSMAN